MPDMPISQVQAFTLHSRPSSTRKIMLDFDGYVTSNSAWNSWKGLANINTPAHDTVSVALMLLHFAGFYCYTLQVFLL